MIIDSHQHVMLPTEQQLAKMNEAGVDRTILFSTSLHIERATTLQETDTELQSLGRVLSGSRTLQERVTSMRNTVSELHAAISFAPDRFYVFGPVPLGLSKEDTATWLEKHIIANSFKGIGEFSPADETQMAQLRLLFSALSDFPALPVWVHTFHPVTLPCLRMLMELCREFPSTPVIFGHMGGVHWMEVLRFAKEQCNVYLDLSAAYTTLSIKTALREVPNRCLFSSDAPFGEPLLSRQMIEFLSPSQEISHMALGDNVSQLLQPPL